MKIVLPLPQTCMHSESAWHIVMTLKKLLVLCPCNRHCGAVVMGDEHGLDLYQGNSDRGSIPLSESTGVFKVREIRNSTQVFQAGRCDCSTLSKAFYEMGNCLASLVSMMRQSHYTTVQ